PRYSRPSRRREPFGSSMQHERRWIVCAGFRCRRSAVRRRLSQNIVASWKRSAQVTEISLPLRCVRIWHRLLARLSPDWPRSRRAMTGHEPFKTRSGARLSFDVLGFGSAPLGNMHRVLSEDEADATVGAAWDSGIRYFDTAPLYGHGLSEIRLGRALRDKKGF